MVTKQQKLKRRLASFAAQHMPEATHSVLTSRDQVQLLCMSPCSSHWTTAKAMSRWCIIWALPSSTLLLTQPFPHTATDDAETRKPANLPPACASLGLQLAGRDSQCSASTSTLPLPGPSARTTDKGARFCRATCAQQARDTKPVIVMQRNFAFAAVKGISTC